MALVLALVLALLLATNSSPFARSALAKWKVLRKWTKINHFIITKLPKGQHKQQAASQQPKAKSKPKVEQFSNSKNLAFDEALTRNVGDANKWLYSKHRHLALGRLSAASMGWSQRHMEDDVIRSLGAAGSVNAPQRSNRTTLTHSAAHNKRHSVQPDLRCSCVCIALASLFTICTRSNILIP